MYRMLDSQDYSAITLSKEIIAELIYTNAQFDLFCKVMENVP